MISGLPQKKGQALQQTVRTTRSVRADAGKLQQILVNLLSNAIKFSPENKRIEIGVEDQGENLRFWVKDEGPGIADSLKRELFMPFVSLQGAAANFLTNNVYDPNGMPEYKVCAVRIQPA